MNLPEIKNAAKYVGLYIVDFGDSSSVGFTSDEVAELLESERFKDARVYKIHKAYPDGRMEIKGVPADIFGLEMGMFFYSSDEQTAKDNYDSLVNIAITGSVPGRAKVHLAKYDESKFVVAIIYPAEYNDEFSQWLIDKNYKPSGPAQGGIEAVESYYRDKPEILQRHQLHAWPAVEAMNGEKLLAATKKAIAR